jgi:Domain of unknown function (DUF4328)/Protein of unknown function (DUF2510)
VSDDSGGYPGAPPGWYADPAGGPGQRWWDGYAWTEATVLPSVPPPPPASATASPPGYPPAPGHTVPPRPTGVASPPWVPQPRQARDLVGDELRISPLARVAIAFPGISALANLISIVANASAYRRFGHELRLSMDAAAHNQPAPVVTVPAEDGLSSVLILVALAALVVVLVWQFRAATAARAMHLPAKRSPGWGVAFWFIPIVNFWMPYQAIRDCLAPADPARAQILRYWLFTIGIEIGYLLTFVAIIISTPVGVILAILTGVCALGVLATAPQVVTSIAVAHQAAVKP